MCTVTSNNNIIDSSTILMNVLLIDCFLRGKFSRKFWGWRGQKFPGKKNVSHEEIFRQNFLARKFWLEFS